MNDATFALIGSDQPACALPAGLRLARRSIKTPTRTTARVRCFRSAVDRWTLLGTTNHSSDASHGIVVRQTSTGGADEPLGRRACLFGDFRPREHPRDFLAPM